MTERFSGTCERICDVDVSAMAAWIAAIPLEAWPQRDRMRSEYPYPAMVSNPSWHDFGVVSEPIVKFISQLCSGRVDHRMLSVVMPGQQIAEHDDVQGPTWRFRVHVPLVTNLEAVMRYGSNKIHMDVGGAYRVNTEVPHSLCNGGQEPRIHFFFDVHDTVARDATMEA